MQFETKKLKIKGAAFNVRELSAGERQKVFKLFRDEVDPIELQATYIQLGCEEYKNQTIDEIMSLPGTVFSELADEVVKLSGLMVEGEDDEKNS